MGRKPTLRSARWGLIPGWWNKSKTFVFGDVGPAPRIDQDIAVLAVREPVQIVLLAKDTTRLVLAAIADIGRMENP